MQDSATNSIETLVGSERPDGCIATLQTKAKRQLGHVASNLFSSRSLLGVFLVVGVVSIILLRSSG